MRACLRMIGCHACQLESSRISVSVSSVSVNYLSIYPNDTYLRRRDRYDTLQYYAINPEYAEVHPASTLV
jgi:hypothetical protein